MRCTGPVRSFIVGLAVLLAATTLFSPATSAQTATPEPSTPAFVIAPSTGSDQYFTESIDAGSKKTLSVSLGNAGEDPLALITYAADAYSLINGGFAVRELGSPATGTTTWLDYQTETLDLKPKELVERKFTVTVPDDTPPGQYITGLVLQTAEPIPVAGSPMLKQTLLKSIAVFITVPGTLTPSFEIGAASVTPATGGWVTSLEIRNTGNALVKPAGTVTVHDGAGNLIVTVPIKMDSVYAGLTTTIEFAIDGTVPPGDYMISAELADTSSGATASASDLALTLSPLNAATPIVNPVTISAVTLDPERDTDGTLKYVKVGVTIANTGDPIANSRLTLQVTLDGKPVEDFVMSASLAVPRGDTDVSARYLPADDWSAGSYGFSVTLDVTDPASGQATLIATAAAPDTVTGP